MDSDILTNTEAAKLLRISTKELKRLVDRGDIAYLSFGTGKKNPHRKYLKSDLTEFAMRKRERKCQSTSANRQASGITTSNSKVVDFMARLA